MPPRLQGTTRLHLYALVALALVAAGCSRNGSSDQPPPSSVRTQAQRLDDIKDYEAIEYPQYIAVRRSATEGYAQYDGGQKPPQCDFYYGNPKTCVVMNPIIVRDMQDNDAGVVRLNTNCTQQMTVAECRRAVLAYGFREIKDKLLPWVPCPENPEDLCPPVETKGRRLATMVMIDTLRYRDPACNPPQQCNPTHWINTFVDDLLFAARQERMPLLLNLDTVNWWDDSSFLWMNDENVEADAHLTPVHIGWRNWGSQIRVKPAPNLASTSFRMANQAVLLDVLPKLKAYYESLSPEDKYLYGGLVFGTEMTEGVSNYFYPDGNRFVDAPYVAGCDPGELRDAGDAGPHCPSPLPVGYPANPDGDDGGCGEYNYNQCPVDPEKFAKSRSGGVEQIGYKAACTMGIFTEAQCNEAADGGTPLPPLDQTNLDAIMGNYLSYLNDLARDSGVPSHKVIAHVGGYFPPTDGGTGGPNSLGIGRYKMLVPGWSLYFLPTRNEVSGYLGPYLASTDDIKALPWATPEWLPYNPDYPDQDDWYTAIEGAANYRNNRLVTVANWEDISGNIDAHQAINASLVGAPPSQFCHVSPSLAVGHENFTVNGVNAGTGLSIIHHLHIAGPNGALATYLLISTTDTLNNDGLLSNLDVANEDVTDQGSYIIRRVNDGGVYAQLVTDGCNTSPDGRKRIMSPVVPIDVTGIGSNSSPPTVPFPRAFALISADEERKDLTMSWDIGDLGTSGHAVYLNVSTDPDFTPIDVINADVTHLRMYTRPAMDGGTYYGRVVVDNPTRYYSNTVTIVVPP